MATELAKAYVQIVPSARGIQGMLQKELGGEAAAAGESAGKSFGDGLRSGLANIGKAAAAALGAASAAVGAFAQGSLNAYGEFEQLIGGAELMFGNAFAFVSTQASNAYKNVQMSQNDYLRQVNGFATGLKTALGGNEQAAAELADKIITAEADIVAATGNSQEAVQNAFNGIMRSNYTMLDNLQLGITPTKEGFQEVIDKVNEWNAANGNATNYMIDNLADAQSALVDYVAMQGLAGYASAEAADTIQGSLASVSGAWQNLLIGIADENADLPGLIENLLRSVTEAAQNNIIPRFQQILTGMGATVQTLAPIISEQIPVLVSTVLPPMVSAGAQLLVGLITGIIAALPELAVAVPQIVGQIGALLAESWPAIHTAGGELIDMLVTGITTQLPVLIPAAAEAVLQLAMALTDPDSLGSMIDSALQLIVSLADGLINALPVLLEKAPVIIDNLVTAISTNLPKILQAGIDLLAKLVSGIISAIPRLVAAVPQIITSFVNGVSSFFGRIFDIGKDILNQVGDGLNSVISNAWTWGSDMLQGFIDGITSKLSALWDSVKGIASGIAEFLHFSRPDVGPLRDYETWMPDFMQGLAKGIDSNTWRVQNALKRLTQGMDLEFSPSVQMPSLHTAAVADTGAPLGGGTVTNLYQTIHTHDSLSESELTREAEDLLDRTRWKNP